MPPRLVWRRLLTMVRRMRARLSRAVTTKVGLTLIAALLLGGGGVGDGHGDHQRPALREWAPLVQHQRLDHECVAHHQWA